MRTNTEQREAFEARPAPPVERGKPHLHPRPKQRPTGRKGLPECLPADVSQRRPELCLCGCGEFTWVDELVEEKLDIQAHQRRRITHRHTGRCKQCGRRTTAEAPPSPFPRSKVTCEWLAWFVCQKFKLLVPLDRVRHYLGAQGLALSMSFLVSQTAHAARLLEAIDGVHWKQLLAGSMLATDGTNFKVQIKGEGLQHAYLEVYHHEDTVVFQFEREKSGSTQAAKLLGFQGLLLVDAESRYNETAAIPGITEANCHAHPRRKLEDAEQMQPVLAVEGGRFITELFDVEEEAKKHNLADDDVVEWRRKHAAFQPVAKLRLNCLFAGGPEGGHRSAVLLGIVATCKRLNVDVEAYLAWVFVRMGTDAYKYEMTAEELTPADPIVRVARSQTCDNRRTPIPPLGQRMGSSDFKRSICHVAS